MRQRIYVFPSWPTERSMGGHGAVMGVECFRAELGPDTTVLEIEAIVEKEYKARHVQLFMVNPEVSSSKSVDIRTLVDLTKKHDCRLADFCESLDDTELVWEEKVGATRQDLLAVCISRAQPAPEENEEEEEEEEAVGELPARYFQRLHDCLKATRTGPTPSQGATSLYAKLQKGVGKFKHLGLHDGCTASDGPPRVAAPVELYHPAFAVFKRCLKANDDIPEDIIYHTTQLFACLSKIHDRENLRDSPELAKHLGNLLHASCPKVVNSDLTAPDGMSICPTPYGDAFRYIREVKSQIGKGGSDPSVQVSLSYCRSWSLEEHNPITERSCCPSFLLSIAGPHISMLGAIITTSPVVQRLTPYLWAANSRSFDMPEITEVARAFYSLRSGIQYLTTEYEALPTPIPQPGFIHPRFVPHFTSYQVDGIEHKFEYVRPLLEDSMVSLAYEVELTTPTQPGDQKPRMVVKFVNRYCADLHRLLAERQMAPPLVHHAPLGLGYEGISMVVMGMVDGVSLWDKYKDKTLPIAVKQKVEEVLKVIEQGGFIYGDLRRPNVMLLNAQSALPNETANPQVQFIDLDWGARVGSGVRYPANLSDVVKDAAGSKHLKVKDRDMITSTHMWNMFKKL